MTTSRLSDNKKKEITQKVAEMTRLIEDKHMHPTDALYETVKHANFTPPMIELMARAYNCGKSIYTRKTGSSIFEKNATYSLADGKEVVNRLLESTDTIKHAAQSLFNNNNIDPVYSEEIINAPYLYKQAQDDNNNQQMSFGERMRIAREKKKKEREAQANVNSITVTGKTKALSTLPKPDVAPPKTASEIRQNIQNKTTKFNDRLKEAAYLLNDSVNKLKQYFYKSARLSNEDIIFGTKLILSNNERACFHKIANDLCKDTGLLPKTERTYSISEEPFNLIKTITKQAQNFANIVKTADGDVISNIASKVDEAIKPKDPSIAYVPDLNTLHAIRKARAKVNLNDAIYNNPISDKSRSKETITNFNRIARTVPNVSSTPIGSSTLVNDYGGKEQVSLGDLLDYIRAEKELSSVNDSSANNKPSQSGSNNNNNK